ncbi:hypothetical protein N7520_002987 [Penicillium odoratum]|uniref:uncharacterized protein n=1 Tax=Penicillium odoratum TaxID=1167516 RepID=UPI0025476A2C|nr:uncharacterized protein N7520_002987 [Penicillium odoratum]KAJ5772458.1 hypothetical protein N7520_002987 [Penicillium odoratum]
MRDSESENSLNHVKADGEYHNEALHVSKRQKRAKYASKACAECKRRKIKCDGDMPCRACVAKGHAYECQRTGTDMRGKWRDTKSTSGSIDDFASRLNRIEQHLSTMKKPDFHPNETCKSAGSQLDLQGDLAESADKKTPGSESCSRSAHVPAFSGETSIAHNLTVVESRLEQMGVQYARLRSPSPSRAFRSCLTPSPDNPPGSHTDVHTSFVNRVLDARGVVPQREQWDRLLRTFCDEGHILVPFLHLPSLYELYEGMWETSLGGRSRDPAPDRSGVIRVQTAHILLCLANGRCVESSRIESDEGRYSAGWSLYKAARDLFGDLLDGFNQSADQIFVLQTVLLMVVYLFRIDAHGSAEKVLALSISHAHHLGLHRNRVVEGMTLFDGEMSRRLWWCLYLMDRRLAIETGRPFLIQDVNVDVGLPRNVDDKLLKQSQITTQLYNSDQATAESEMASVSYLIAMASYSKVIGKVWEALYGAAMSDSTPSPLLNEYLEHLITQSQKGIHEEFSFDPHNPGSDETSGLPWWQIKQKFIMRIRWTSLYLLIRKPMIQNTVALNQPVPEAIENEVICMRMAQNIFDDFNRMPEQHPKYTFPFLHYLTNATIIALGLIIRQPSFKQAYGELTMKAARSLWEHCRKTWVSGRMTRTVWKLNQMADATLSRPGDRLQEGAGHSLQILGEPVPDRQSCPPSIIVPGPAPSTSKPKFSTTERDLLNGKKPGSQDLQIVSATSILQTSRPMPVDEPMINQSTRTIQNPEERHRVECIRREQAELRTRMHAAPESGVFNGSGSFEIAEPRPCSFETLQMGHNDLDVDISLPGELIDGGMEWLQSLFVDGLGTDLPPVWD